VFDLSGRVVKFRVSSRLSAPFLPLSSIPIGTSFFLYCRIKYEKHSKECSGSVLCLQLRNKVKSSKTKS